MVLLSKTSPARRTQLGQSGWWMATSRVSRGKLLVNMKKGESVPDDWALAIDGSRTTDAAQAFRGILLPLGYKGYGMAVIVDMLSGVLNGSGFGVAVDTPKDKPIVGSSFLYSCRVISIVYGQFWTCSINLDYYSPIRARQS